MPTNPEPSAPARSAPPQRGEFRFWTEEKLRNADTDQFRHVNNAVFSTLLEAARMEIFAPREIHPLMEGANLAVVRLLVEFRHELFFPGRVEIGSIVTRVGNSSFGVRQAVFSLSSDICAVSAEATCVLLQPRSGRPHSISPSLRDYLLGQTA